jgi:hypothetical protein
MSNDLISGMLAVDDTRTILYFWLSGLPVSSVNSSKFNNESFPQGE